MYGGGVKTEAAADLPSALELRHLRYFVALADTGSFTRAAERIFIAQPTLSQQIRRLEELIGAPLVERRRHGLRLTSAGAALLDGSRAVLSLLGHEVDRTRQVAGVGRPRLCVAIPPRMPEGLAAAAVSSLQAAAAAAEVELSWAEATVDAEFSLVARRRADAALGWLTTAPGALPEPLDVMSLGEFEPDVWVPAPLAAQSRELLSLGEVAGLQVIHGPRRAGPGTYDAWTRVMQALDPQFEFTDPPLSHSLQMSLAFAAASEAPAAVLTGPAVIAGSPPGPSRPARQAGCHEMVRVRLERHPLTATAALVWHGDLPRPLQQLIFDAAAELTAPAAPAA